MNKDEILLKHLAQHTALGSRIDSDDKDKFDQEHRQIWTECDQELGERLAELDTKDTLTPKEQQELDELHEFLS